MMYVYRFALEEEEYVEFSKLTQDRIIGTKGEVAMVSLNVSKITNITLYNKHFVYITFIQI